MRPRNVILTSMLAFCTLAASAQAQRANATREPNTYGTTSESFYRVGSTEFSPIDTSVTYNDLGNISSTLSRYVTGCATFCELLAVPHLPSGALVTGVEFDFCDTNATTFPSLVVFTSTYTGEGATNIGQVNGIPNDGCANHFLDLTSANFTVDNNLNQIFFAAFFGSTDGTNSISGVIVHYKLQVSPAPVSPTFNDVQPSNPQFQFVEALAASGITAGCGGGNYCPNNPVTRGQMAVFLAKALGLQFP
jgi:hypothetical protein